MIDKRTSEEELKETRKENYGLETIKELSKNSPSNTEKVLASNENQ